MDPTTPSLRAARLPAAGLPTSAAHAAPRAPLDVDQVAEALSRVHWAGPAPTLLTTVPTTAEHCTRDAATGAPHLTSAVAESTEVPLLPGHDPRAAAPGTTLWVSVLLRHAGPADGHDGWLPLAMSLAVADAVRTVAHLPAEVEWPDEVGIPGAMCGGAAGVRHLGRVAVERHGEVRIASVAISVDPDPLGLPPDATSLLMDGGRTDRAALLAALLLAIDRRHRQWTDGDPSLAADYRERCRTLGRIADAATPGADRWISGIDTDGDLLITG